MYCIWLPEASLSELEEGCVKTAQSLNDSYMFQDSLPRPLPKDE
jgi:hypothetical protein